MLGEPAGTLVQKVLAVKQIVECLLGLCRGIESDEWLAKFVTVDEAMSAGRLRDAVREEARLTWSLTPKWVLSRDLEKRLEKAMGVLHRHVSYPGHSEPAAEFADLPCDITSQGTLEEQKLRMIDAFRRSFQRDPLEEDPAYADILAAASEQAEKDLADHPMNGGMGFCHVFWERKQEILRNIYGLEWRTPRECNPNIIFD